MGNSVVFLVLDLIVWDMETGACEFQEVFSSRLLPDSDTHDSTLYIKNSCQSKKNNQQKKAPSNSAVSPPKKKRLHQEFEQLKQYN